ncbi:MAG TPA: hypothetical protein DCZ13_00020 [Porticoccaceae bacterium]|nr:hypothetical protein [Porticoccaceae bacterium]
MPRCSRDIFGVSIVLLALPFYSVVLRPIFLSIVLYARTALILAQIFDNMIAAGALACVAGTCNAQSTSL